ncbi:MAG: hypothetical protein UT48_C0017G0020 [Parcubacteria group bacterium GW2011_GWE2_39_37]|nr:MAG: hypothetical protein UT48_C0017G0020 [Parcubacteria group bacterium GW2011_GWE2_39_37]
MKNKLTEKFFIKINPAFFWTSMAIVIMLSLYVIFENYKISASNYALAADLNYVIDKNVVKHKKNEFIECDCEKRFKRDYPIMWSGRVIASFVSGEDVGVERYDKKTRYNQFYLSTQGKYDEKLGSDIRVNGRMVGITCAYANSIFGACVADVIADKITYL